MLLLTTTRLHLKEFEIEDAENMYLLNSDPEVIKYTGDVAFNTIEEAKSLIQNYDHYQKYGFGRWSVF